MSVHNESSREARSFYDLFIFQTKCNVYRSTNMNRLISCNNNYCSSPELE